MPTVFGLDVQSDRPLSFLEQAEARPTGRGLELSLLEDPEAIGWPAAAELISDQRKPDGSVNFQIESRAEMGFRIWGPEYGVSVISADGKRLLGAVDRGREDAWQRLLVAQALPFAAVLQGLEVLHASAVATEEGAVALSGRSGSGKTSLALELCRRGADFLADDVLALERVDGQLVGHPGAPVAGIDRAEAERLSAVGGTGRPEVLAADRREQVARVPASASPLPLRTLFFLDRRSDGPARPCFEPAADAQALLSATFNLVLTGAQRLERLLDACALLASCRVERIACGPAVGVAQLGDAIEGRIGER
ncbi:MAG TPA: hypothetical protein VIY71_09370 [Solirubrobacterales bacterium]